MSAITGRKHTNSFVEDEEFDLPLAKRVKDSDSSETSSEGTVEDNKIARMAEAMKTIIEVSFLACLSVSSLMCSDICLLL